MRYHYQQKANEQQSTNYEPERIFENRSVYVSYNKHGTKVVDTTQKQQP